MGAIPVLDLRLLSQADINAIAEASSSAAGDSRRFDDILIPKIDRSVFNESAGSRRQTYSRLRLAPRKPPDLSPAASIPPAAAADDDSRRLENGRVIQLLRQLFSGNGIQREEPKSLEEEDSVPDLKASGVEMANWDLFEEKLARMTEGMETEEQLLDFLGALEGKWASSRKRRKIVNASHYASALPKGWKLLLGLQRKHRNVRLHCRRYISPCGKQFTSYEEASSYLLSHTGLQEATPTNALESTSENSRNPQAFDFGRQETMEVKCPASTLSVSFDVGNQGKIECQQTLRCEKCNITFADKDSEMQHSTAFHKRGRKRSRHRKSMTDGVIIRDGAFECQFCHKLFTERRKYNGHVGIHVRYTDWGLHTSKPASTSPDSEQLNSINRGDLSAGPVCPDGGVHVNGTAVDHSVKEVGAGGESHGGGGSVQTDDREGILKSSGDGGSFSQEKCCEIDQVSFMDAENIVLDVLDEQVPEKPPEKIDAQNGLAKMFHVGDPDIVTSQSAVCAKSGNDEVVRSENRITDELERDGKFGVAIQVVQDEIHLSEEIRHGDLDSLMEGSARMNDEFSINDASLEEHFCDHQAKVQMQGDMKSDREDEGHVSLGEKLDG